LVDANVRNAVVLTGDVHRNWANDLKVDYKDATITKDALTADFRTLDHITTPGAPVSTKASFAVQDGVPGHGRLGR
jgi:alkaline phosphatase D